MSMIFWIFAKFFRVRKLFWIVAAMSAIAPLRSGHPGQTGKNPSGLRSKDSGTGGDLEEPPPEPAYS
jgi:hypothetical protein